MPRPPKPWFRKFTGTWYVNIGGQQINLGKDKKEAFRQFHEIMAEKPTVSGEHLAVILDKFLDWTQAERSPATYRWYRDFLQSFKDTHPMLLVRDLKPHHVEEWAAGKSKRAKITAMKRALNWAEEMGHVARSPIARMSRPEVGSRVDTVTPEEYANLLSHVSDREFRDLLEFSLETGTRPQESKALEASQVDFDRSLCVIHYLDAKGKRKTRVIYLTERAEEILVPLVKKHTSGELFRNTRGDPWTANAVRCRFDRLEKKIGRRLTQYAFRHTWITEKLAAGVDSHIVAKLAGHSSTRELDRTYSHVADDYKFMLEQARRKARRGGEGDRESETS
jgi:integrase